MTTGKFEVNLVRKTGNKSDAPKDQLSTVGHMFYTVDKQSGRAVKKPTVAVDVSEQTAAAQGYSSWKMVGSIPLYLNYKADVEDYNGPLKGKHVLVIGQFPRQRNPDGSGGGSSGILIPVDQVKEFIENLAELKGQIDNALPKLLAQLKELPPPANAAPADREQDDEDDDAEYEDAPANEGDLERVDQ